MVGEQGDLLIPIYPPASLEDRQVTGILVPSHISSDPGFRLHPHRSDGNSWSGVEQRSGVEWSFRWVSFLEWVEWSGWSETDRQEWRTIQDSPFLPASHGLKNGVVEWKGTCRKRKEEWSGTGVEDDGFSYLTFMQFSSSSPSLCNYSATHKLFIHLSIHPALS